jgi:hypothetical protein
LLVPGWRRRNQARPGLMSLNPPVAVTTRIRSPGRARYKPLKPLRGECRVYSGVPVVTTLVCHFTFAREAPGAAGTRHSLRPLLGESFMQNSGASRRGNACSCLKLGSRHCEPTGRANARPMTGSAKQSISPRKGRMDCFVASLLAMTAWLFENRIRTRVHNRCRPGQASAASAIRDL